MRKKENIYKDIYTYGFGSNISLYIVCLNIHGTHVTANNSTNNNAVFFFCFRFEISIL